MKSYVTVFMVIIAVLVLVVDDSFAQDEFRIPRRMAVLPATYLEKMKVRNAERVLTEKEKHDIAKLFVAMHLITKKKYKQDYLIEVNAPIYRLFRKNFPNVSSKEGEGGIFIGYIYDYIVSMPAYKDDLNEVRNKLEATQVRIR